MDKPGFFYKKLHIIILVAFAVRAFWALAGWKTSYIEAQENSITITYQRSAYLLAFGYGYSQTRIASPAYFELSSTIVSIHAGKNYETQFSEEEIYKTQHYPPAWSIIGAGLFLATQIPVAYVMQALGIGIDIITLLILFQLFLCFGNERVALRSAWIYALFPPLIAASVSMSPDSFIILFISGIALCFIKYTRGEVTLLKTIFFIGILNGIGALFRPDFILYPAFLSLLILFPLTFSKFKKAFLLNTGIGLISFLILLPWGIRNKIITGEFSITTTSLGGTLVTGLAALPNPWNLGPTDMDRLKDAQEVGLNKPFEYEADKYFRKKFSEYIADDPGFYLKLIAYRTIYFIAAPYGWGLERHGSTNAFSQARSEGKLFASTLGLLKNYWDIALSLIFNFACYIFIFLMLRKKTYLRFLQFAAVTVLSVYITHIPIYITSTYILPVSFLAIFIIASGIETIFRTGKQQAA